MTNHTLSDSSYNHIIDLPIERIDIADWAFNLPNNEYKRCCPPDHIAVGTTTTDDGRRMSINVEMIGDDSAVCWRGHGKAPVAHGVGVRRLLTERTNEGADHMGAQREAYR